MLFTKADWKTAALALVLIVSVAAGTRARAASVVDRRIQVAPTSMRDAVVITKVSVGGSEVNAKIPLGPCQVQPVTPFKADDNWLEGITLSFFNRTNKTIDYLEFTLRFSEAGNRGYNMRLGRIPENAAFLGKGRPGEAIVQDSTRQPLFFVPGQRLVVSVRDYFYQIKEGLEQQKPPAGFTQVLINPQVAFFDDGMKWAGGAYALPDPRQRGHWKYFDEKYFPGDIEDNLPPGRRWEPIPCGR